MNARTLPFRFASALPLIALFLAGCWQDRVVWSPDGKRAAIITKYASIWLGPMNVRSASIILGVRSFFMSLP